MKLARAILLGCMALALVALPSVPEAEAQNQRRPVAAKKAAAPKKAVAPKKAAAAKKAAKPLKITPTKRQAAPAKTARQKAASPRGGRGKAALRAQPLAAQTFGSAPASSARDLLTLTPVQRALIYRTIVEAPLTPNPVVIGRARRPVERSPEAALPPPTRPATPAAVPANELVVGAPLPAAVPLHPLPQDAVAALPQIERYRYAFVGDRVLLVDPSTGIVVAAINQ